MFPSISPKQSFPALESEVLAYWKANDTFQKSIDSRPEDNPYRFYDGPPFITGTPHYGSLLSSIVKDAVGRYWTMRGKRVDRVWGWDCHGLPIEEKVQKKLGLKSNKDIEERGIKEFIDGCYEYTESTSAEWEWYIDKIGRWVDMDHAYRTMDQDYMESVMWVFSQLWNKGLIYEGKRVSLYSWKLSTPISNFEVAMDDTYQDVNDPAITVKFRLDASEKFPAGTSILAWTTTPWTIPANMALAVGEDIDYVLVKHSDEYWDGKLHFGARGLPELKPDGSAVLIEKTDTHLILAKNRVENIFTKGLGHYEIIRAFKGSELVGLSYVPPFPEYYHGKRGDKAHHVYAADFATDTDGTGIVHIAPEFGDVDFGLAKKYGIPVTEALDDEGRYTAEIYDMEGVHYLDLEQPENGANKRNIERMKADGTLFKNESITHRVPFCPRSGTPLVQKAQSSWFIDIQSQKEKLIQANEQINWFPEYLKEGRFKKGIESAPDWCISRTRFWGAPMPVWMSEDRSERLVVSSREEIYERNQPYGQLTKLIITRHAESQANVDKHYDDIGLSPLSKKGREQAESLLTELQEKGVDIIITSPFLRAIQTAEPLAKKLGIEIITDERLRETNHGKMANAHSSPELKIERNTTFFGDDKDHKFAETGESYNDVLIRTTAVIEDICVRYPGKTVLVVTHGFPTGVMSAYLRDKKIRDRVENATSETFILDVANKKQLNLHRPYIDSVFLENPKARKAKKVLGIHGWERQGIASGETEFWEEVHRDILSQGITFDVPNFDTSKDTTYARWKSLLDTLDVRSYDTIIAHSFGCPVIIQYLLEEQISLDRLILVAPSGLIGNPYFENILSEFSLPVKDIKKYVSEIVILHSEDDHSESAHFRYGSSLAADLGVPLIHMNGYGHDFLHGKKLISALIASGTPMRRIPEVLDVWLDSGSMPYAQMHYPFENKTAMEASFPADFIAEYVGQVRAWFYVMHVLGVLLNPTDKSVPTPSFTNVITTGVINGNDGRKMSKSYGNYPDPRITIEKYGADPIRFYMLNSPLLSGGDMDFKEEGIIETIKGVMLPIWNTYSFFTTYANIDTWTPDTTEVWFTRHAESESNVAGRMSDGSDNPALTENGLRQAKSAGEALKEQGKNFDIIIHTDRIRAHDTAHSIGDTIGFTGEYIIDDGFAEQTAGEYANMTLEEIAAMHGIDSADSKNHPELRKIYKNNSVENIEQFESRILSAYEKLIAKYRGKRILIVAHAGTPRPMLHKYMGMSYEQAYYDTSIKNADPFELMTTPIANPLDRWILSKLQVLIGQVHDAMDGYDVSRACRAIVEYMDELTNWYVRLSRRRFWESGMTPDKASAYSTLYSVLAEISKLLAPFMPFLAESIYRGLTGRESVHLEYITRPHRHLVDAALNRDMQICEHVVSLGLALRSRENIRVRQPLQSVTITSELSPYYQAIIRDELNVKEVRYEDPEKLAKKICKPDARKIGPKYGKDVQAIIIAAKNGHFIELEDGKIEVTNLPKPFPTEEKMLKYEDLVNTEIKFILEAGEYVMEYLPLEGVGDVIGGYGMVIALDTTITDDLRLEGYARDIVRLIQDMRKEADYNVSDRISLSISGEGSADIISRFGAYIAHETLSTLVESLSSPDIEKTEAIEEGVIITLATQR